MRIYGNSQGSDRSHFGRQTDSAEQTMAQATIHQVQWCILHHPTRSRSDLYPEGKEQVKAMVQYYMDNARIMKKMLSKTGIQFFGGENAPYLWIKAPDNQTSWKFFDKLLYEAQVVSTPGVGFGPSGEGYVRLTSFGERHQCEEGIQRICQCL